MRVLHGGPMFENVQRTLKHNKTKNQASFLVRHKSWLVLGDNFIEFVILVCE